MSILQRIALAFALALGFIGSAFAANEARPAPLQPSMVVLSNAAPSALAAASAVQTAQGAPADLAFAFSSVDADKLELLSGDEMVATEGGLAPVVVIAMYRMAAAGMSWWSFYQRWGGQASFVMLRTLYCRHSRSC